MPAGKMRREAPRIFLGSGPKPATTIGALLRLSAVSAALVTGAGAAAAESRCPAPLQPMLRAELLFGRNIAGRLGVTDAAWRRFLADEITPRFPNGLTVIDGSGQWRSGGRIARERSKIVLVLTPADEAGVAQRLQEIIATYKQRFRQRSVGLVLQPVCGGFP